MIIVQLIIYFLSFAAIWFGAGMIVSAVDRLAQKLKLSSFAMSFFVLGILTSIPEISVGINSIIDGDPEIFVGNLIGGTVVLYLLAIPILAVFGNGIILDHKLTTRNLVFSLLVVSAPAFLIIDGKITAYGGIFLILLYLALFYFIEKGKGLMEKVKDNIFHHNNHLLKDVSFILLGIAVIFLSSKYLVDMTIYYSEIISISPFIISLLLLALGTNLPELSLAVRAIYQGKTQVALGDYVGSAAANTLIFGVMTILNGKDIYVANNFLTTFFFIIFGLGLFFLFSRSKHDISRIEGFILLGVYLLFVFFEIRS